MAISPPAATGSLTVWNVTGMFGAYGMQQDRGRESSFDRKRGIKFLEQHAKKNMSGSVRFLKICNSGRQGASYPDFKNAGGGIDHV
jgi:hypothetical protein